MPMELTRIGGWSALASGAAAILALIAIALFFAGVPSLGPANDLLLALMALSMAPIAVALFRLAQQRFGPVAVAVLLIGGLAAMLVFAINKVLMVLGVVRVTTYTRIGDRTLATAMLGFAGVGLWLLAANLLGRWHGWLPAGLTWLGVAVGLGFILMAATYWRWGGSHPLMYVSGLAWQLGYSIWAIWLGRMLLAGQLPR